MKNCEVVDKDYVRVLDKEEVVKNYEEINVYYVVFIRVELGLIVVVKDKKESKKESKNKIMCEKLDFVFLEEGEIMLVIFL